MCCCCCICVHVLCAGPSRTYTQDLLEEADIPDEVEEPAEDLDEANDEL